MTQAWFTTSNSQHIGLLQGQAVEAGPGQVQHLLAHHLGDDGLGQLDIDRLGPELEPCLSHIELGDGRQQSQHLGHLQTLLRLQLIQASASEGN